MLLACGSGAEPPPVGDPPDRALESLGWRESRLEMRPGDPESPFVSGWEPAERFRFGPSEAPRSVRWGTGRGSRLHLERGDNPPPSRLHLRLLTLVEGQVLSLSWNGELRGAFPLPHHEWIELDVALPGQAARGADQLELAYSASYTGEPGRDLAVLFDFVGVRYAVQARPASPGDYQRLASVTRSDVVTLPLPGALRLRRERVEPGDAIAFAYATSAVASPHARTRARVVVRESPEAGSAGGATLFTQQLENVGRKPYVAVAAVRTTPSRPGAQALADGHFGGDRGGDRVWRASGMGDRIELTLDPPRRINALSVGRDESGAATDGVPWRIRVTLEDGDAAGAPPSSLLLAHHRDSRHQWHVLPDRLTSRVSLEIPHTHDRRPAVLDEVVLAHVEDPVSLHDGLGRWHHAVVDLSEFAGRGVEVDLEIDAPDCADGPCPAQATGYWSGPVWLRAADAARPNLVLISLDTVRADRMSSHGYPRDTTPFLAGLAERSGAHFWNARSSSTWTAPSHLSLFTGLTPLHHRVNPSVDQVMAWQRGEGELRTLHPSLPTLASLLRGRGYYAVGLSSMGATQAELGLRAGFHHYEDPRNNLPERPLDYDDELRARADHVTGWLERLADRRFLLFLHSYVAHHPYKGLDLAGCGEPTRAELCERYAERLYPTANMMNILLEDGLRERGLLDRAFLSDLYDGGLRLADSLVRRVFADLRRLGLDGKTVVVVTSDHGEAFGEHLASYYGAHGYAFYEEFLRVPLSLWLPGRDGRVDSHAPVSGVDLLPTLLDALGVDAPQGLAGRSLMPVIRGGSDDELERRTIFYEGTANEVHEPVRLISASRGSFKIHANPYDLHDGRHALFDLATDPGERRDVAGEHPELTHGLLASLDEHILDAFRGMLVIDLRGAAGGQRRRVAGRMTFQATAEAFDLALRGGGDALTASPDGRAFEFALELGSERRLIGFELSEPDPALSFELLEAADCDVVYGEGRGAPGAARWSRASSLALDAAPPATARPASGCRAHVYALAPAPGRLRRPPRAREQDRDDAQRTVEALRALGYVE